MSQEEVQVCLEAADVAVVQCADVEGSAVFEVYEQFLDTVQRVRGERKDEAIVFAQHIMAFAQHHESPSVAELRLLTKQLYYCTNCIKQHKLKDSLLVRKLVEAAKALFRLANQANVRATARNKLLLEILYLLEELSKQQYMATSWELLIPVAGPSMSSPNSILGPTLSSFLFCCDNEAVQLLALRCLFNVLRNSPLYAFDWPQKYTPCYRYTSSIVGRYMELALGSFALLMQLLVQNAYSSVLKETLYVLEDLLVHIPLCRLSQDVQTFSLHAVPRLCQTSYEKTNVLVNVLQAVFKTPQLYLTWKDVKEPLDEEIRDVASRLQLPLPLTIAPPRSVSLVELFKAGAVGDALCLCLVSHQFSVWRAYVSTDPSIMQSIHAAPDNHLSLLAAWAKSAYESIQTNVDQWRTHDNLFAFSYDGTSALMEKLVLISRTDDTKKRNLVFLILSYIPAPFWSHIEQTTVDSVCRRVTRNARHPHTLRLLGTLGCCSIPNVRTAAIQCLSQADVTKSKAIVCVRIAWGLANSLEAFHPKSKEGTIMLLRLCKHNSNEVRSNAFRGLAYAVLWFHQDDAIMSHICEALNSIVEEGCQNTKVLLNVCRIAERLMQHANEAPCSVTTLRRIPCLLQQTFRNSKVPLHILNAIQRNAACLTPALRLEYQRAIEHFQESNHSRVVSSAVHEATQRALAALSV